MSGLKRHTVKLEKHSPEWKNDFENEKKTLSEVIGDKAIGIYHIGSTAVPGISAKPIIDIAVEIKNFSELRNFDDELKKNGFIHRPVQDTPYKRLYTKGDKDFRSHHVHFYEENSEQLKNDLFFRDYLVSHPKTAKQYDELKQNLAAKYSNDRKRYTKGKEEFIESILAKRQLRKKK